MIVHVPTNHPLFLLIKLQSNHIELSEGMESKEKHYWEYSETCYKDWYIQTKAYALTNKASRYMKQKEKPPIIMCGSTELWNCWEAVVVLGSGAH